jgi:hypothetical protein
MVQFRRRCGRHKSDQAHAGRQTVHFEISISPNGEEWGCQDG